MYEFTSRVRYSEIGPDRNMTPTALVTRMQDCCVFHSESIGRGPVTLAENSCAWLIISWQVKLYKMPLFGSRVTTKTWAYAFHGFEGDRNFAIYELPAEGADAGSRPLQNTGSKLPQNADTGADAAAPGTLCAVANSRWVYFDRARRRPVRIPDEEVNGFGLDPKLDMAYAPRRIVLPNEKPEIRKPIEITETDIDTNRHVNNLKYIDMALAFLPSDFEIAELRVEYIRQCRLGDMLYPKLFLTDEAFFVSLDNSTGHPCAIVEFMVQ